MASGDALVLVVVVCCVVCDTLNMCAWCWHTRQRFECFHGGGVRREGGGGEEEEGVVVSLVFFSLVKQVSFDISCAS